MYTHIVLNNAMLCSSLEKTYNKIYSVIDWGKFINVITTKMYTLKKSIPQVKISTT
jgi:hypothetical protein